MPTPMPTLQSHLPSETKEIVLHIAKLVRDAGGQTYLVGGCVRDALLGRPIKDIDIEVFSLATERLEKLLRQHFPLDCVGKSYGVFKLKGYPIDISLPRQESKTGLGHKAFAIRGNPHLSIAEAAHRRDFTLNAIYWHPLTEVLTDPYQGIDDLRQGRLRHVSDKFSEDPLRVLRGMQLAARFQLRATPETLTLCQQITSETLAKERIFEEWRKLICLGKQPSLGLQFLKDCHWISYFPALANLVGCPQDPLWHPEGDVWTHTLLCLDAFAQQRTADNWEDLIVGLAVLGHDFGKPATTMIDSEGRIRSPRHEIVGVGIAETFLSQLTEHKALIQAVLPLIACHMTPANLYKQRVGDNAVRRLAHKVGRIDRLVRVCKADKAGCVPRPYNFAAEDWLLARAEALAVKAARPKPFVQGRHLLELGLKPSPLFKKLLDECYEAQLDGQFLSPEDSLVFTKELLKRKGLLKKISED